MFVLPSQPAYWPGHMNIAIFIIAHEQNVIPPVNLLLLDIVVGDLPVQDHCLFQRFCRQSPYAEIEAKMPPWFRILLHHSPIKPKKSSETYDVDALRELSDWYVRIKLELPLALEWLL